MDVSNFCNMKICDWIIFDCGILKIVDLQLCDQLIKNDLFCFCDLDEKNFFLYSRFSFSVLVYNDYKRKKNNL